MNQPNELQTSEANILPRKFSPAIFVLGAIGVCFIAGFVGFNLGNSATRNTQQNDASTPVLEQSNKNEKITKSVGSNLADQNQEPQQISLEKLGIFIDFPSEYDLSADLLEKKPADSGSQVCSKENEQLQICATSRHFTVGRGGRFIDNHGYLESANGYYVLFPFNEDEVSMPLAQKYLSKSGVEILKIKGKSEQTDLGYFPVEGTPGDGYLAAIINTGDPDNYDGVTILMKLSDTLLEQDFNTILDSIRLEK